MIVELGHYALVLALFLALLQASLPLVGAARGQLALMALADTTAVTLLIMAFGGLVSLSDRRLRIGAPARRTASPPSAARKALAHEVV